MAVKFNKLSNGEGSITKLSGKRRRPYIIKTPIVYNVELGKAKREIIGYAATYPEALKILYDFNAKQLNLEMLQTTSFKVILDYVLKEKKETVTKAVYKNYINIFDNHFTKFYDKNLVNIKLEELQNIIDPLKFNTGKRAITILKEVFNEGIKKEIIVRNIADFLKARNKTEKSVRTIYTPSEIKILWDNEKEFAAKISLLQLYSGCRISEIFGIKIENIYLKERYFVGGCKTKAGKNRIIPIHKKIVPILSDFLNDNPNKTGYLFTNKKQRKYLLETYRNAYNKFNAEFNINHGTHDCRHTFISKMQALNAPISKLKKIVGHTSSDVTEAVYTHYTYKDLVPIVDMLKY